MIQQIANLIARYKYKCLCRKYFYLYNKQAFGKAYDVLKEAVELQNLHNKGFTYVTYAELELLVYDDIKKARELLDEAFYALGYDFNDSDYSLYGTVLYRAGEHEKGLGYLEKSVEMNPSIHNLKKYANILSYAHDKRAEEIWERILEESNFDLDIYIFIWQKRPLRQVKKKKHLH